MRRLSFRRGGISSRIDSIITNLRKIALDNHGLPTPRCLMPCSESQCIRLWKRLRTSYSSNGRTKGLETLRGTTWAFIANTIETRDTLWRNVGIYRTIWNSWSKKESWSSCCIIPAAKRSRLVWILGGMILKTSSRNDQCHLRCPRKNQILSLQSNVRDLTTYRGLQFGAQKS